MTLRGISPCDVCEIRKICIGLDKGIKDGQSGKTKVKLMSMKDIEIPKTGKFCRVCGKTYESNREFEQMVIKKDGLCPTCTIKSLIQNAQESGVIRGRVDEFGASIEFK